MKNQRGMTLVELMVVVALVGILSAMAIPILNSKRDKVKSVSRQIHQNITMARITAIRDGFKTSAIISNSGEISIVQYRSTVSPDTQTVLQTTMQNYKVTVTPDKTELIYRPDGTQTGNGIDILVTDGETKFYISVGPAGLARIETSPKYSG